MIACRCLSALEWDLMSLREVWIKKQAKCANQVGIMAKVLSLAYDTLEAKYHHLPPELTWQWLLLCPNITGCHIEKPSHIAWVSLSPSRLSRPAPPCRSRRGWHFPNLWSKCSDFSKTGLWCRLVAAQVFIATLHQLCQYRERKQGKGK